MAIGVVRSIELLRPDRQCGLGEGGVSVWCWVLGVYGWMGALELEISLRYGGKTNRTSSRVGVEGRELEEVRSTEVSDPWLGKGRHYQLSQISELQGCGFQKKTPA